MVALYSFSLDLIEFDVRRHQRSLIDWNLPKMTKSSFQDSCRSKYVESAYNASEKPQLLRNLLVNLLMPEMSLCTLW